MIFPFLLVSYPQQGPLFGPGTKLDLDDALDGLAEVASVGFQKLTLFGSATVQQPRFKVGLPFQKGASFVRSSAQ